MDLLEKWYNSLLASPISLWKASLTAHGECRRHTGPGMWYATVEIMISPSDELRIDDKLNATKRGHVIKWGWYEQIVFGVLDVMLTGSTAPIRQFKLTILDIDYNEIESNSMAFRLAARDAAQTILNSKTHPGADLNRHT